MMDDEESHYYVIVEEDDPSDTTEWNDDEDADDVPDPFATLPYIGDPLSKIPQNRRDSLTNEFYTATEEDDDDIANDVQNDQLLTERMNENSKNSILSRFKDNLLGFVQPSRKKPIKTPSKTEEWAPSEDTYCTTIAEDEDVDDDNDTEGPQNVEDANRWACNFCTYQNKTEDRICQVCFKTNVRLATREENAEFATKSKLVSKPNEKKPQQHLESLLATEQKQRQIRRIQADYNITAKSVAEMVLELTSDGYEEKDAVEAIEKCKTLETARLFINCLIEAKELKRKRVRKLLGESKLNSHDEGDIAVELMNSGCDEELAVHLAKECDQLDTAMEYFQYIQEMEKDERKKKQMDELINNNKATKIQAVIAMQLIDMGKTEEEALWALKYSSQVDDAISLLDSICPICEEKFPPSQAFSMHTCTDKFCQQCAKTYFSTAIKQHVNILNVKCPICETPKFEEIENDYMEYFNFLGVMLKTILDPEDFELFQNKLRDMNVERDPNFRWCQNCNNGFLVEGGARKVTCPNCQHSTCSQCKREWKPQHDGILCEDYSKWCEDNKTESQTSFINKLLNENGIGCPKCNSQFELAKGGCMHFTCPQCKHQFCCGCNQPFLRNDECNFSADCQTKGLHAHHSRRCLYYLRDKSPAVLLKVLQETKVEYKTENLIEGLGEQGSCPVMEQKETQDGMTDEKCGEPVEANQGGVCSTHYTEYLVGLINKCDVDPVGVYDTGELLAELRRNNKQVPAQNLQETDDAYRKRIIEVIRRDIPLLVPQRQQRL